MRTQPKLEAGSAEAGSAARRRRMSDLGELKEGMYVVLHSLTSTMDYNGLLCTVKKNTTEDRVAVHVCETDKSIKVRRRNLFYCRADDDDDESEDTNKPSLSLVAQSRLPPIMSSMKSLLAGTRKFSPKDPRFNQGLALIRANMEKIILDETSDDFTIKCAKFLMGDACFLQTDFHGVVRALDEFFPLNSAMIGAWGDVALMGSEVVVAVQNLATAKSMLGSSSDEVALLKHAVERFRASPLPRHQLLPFYLNIGLSTKSTQGASQAIPWLQKAVESVRTVMDHDGAPLPL